MKIISKVKAIQAIKALIERKDVVPIADIKEVVEGIMDYGAEDFKVAERMASIQETMRRIPR